MDTLQVLLLTLPMLCFTVIGKTDDFPPLPVLPIPSWRQLEFHQRSLSMFFHFGVNTFTDSERGTGQESPSVFAPDALNASQWMDTAKSAGAELVILTVKHHDGFCLWPSAYTNFSVASSPWKNGTGDVVREFVTAARDQGLEVGIYLSPWDMHESTYGDTLLYNEYYLGQLRELLTGYGRISEVWLDGAKSANATDMKYMFQSWFDTIHQLQPGANIFSDAGPDIRWVGNEYGESGETCWSMVNRSSITIGKSDGEYLMRGEESGIDWVPPECDISIRPGWFWHENEYPKTLEQLLQVYYKSTGRNCLLLLNVPPNKSGLIDEQDIQVLKEFKSAINNIFSVSLAVNASVSASSVRGASFQPSEILIDSMSYWAPTQGEEYGWLEVNLGETVEFNVIEIREPISMGQRIMEYYLEAWNGYGWNWLVGGTTIGHRRLERLSTVVSSQVVRLVIEESRADPLVSYFGLYIDRYNISVRSDEARAAI